MKRRWNIVFGGPAGTGPNFVTKLIGEALVELGYYVFYSRNYQSLIRGGHNFNQLTFSEQKVYSNDSEVDILVCLDTLTEKLHKKKLIKKGVILKGNKKNLYYSGALFKLLGIDFKILEKLLKNEKDYSENINSAKQGYNEEKRTIYKIILKNNKNNLMNGSQGISEGAIKSGMDIYYAYPMTPATAVLNELAQRQSKDDLFVLELENEIAVANAGVGSAMTGAKVLVGTSGGGFDLMTETLSLCGIAEIPLVFYLSQRPGPATGVATYTAQGDLNLARHSGHGEFSRIVLAPGCPKEAEELTNQAFYLSQKFQTPSIILGDKHLAESYYTLDKNSKIIPVPRLSSIKRYNSYEKDSNGCATENAKLIKKNIERRLKKQKEIEKESKKFSRYEIYGDKKSNNVILSWGSTKGAILDAIKDLDCKFVQIKYIEPFAKEIKKKLDGKNLILIENNSTGQLGNLISEKTGIFIEEKNKILRYDGRPFFADELREEIQKRVK